MNMRFDIEYINPLNNPGIIYAIEADCPQQACNQAPYWLAASSQWRPDQFTVISAKISMYEDKV